MEFVAEPSDSSLNVLENNGDENGENYDNGYNGKVILNDFAIHQS